MVHIVYGQVIYNKEANIYNVNKTVFLINHVGKLDRHMQKGETGLLSCTIYKN